MLASDRLGLVEGEQLNVNSNTELILHVYEPMVKMTFKDAKETY